MQHWLTGISGIGMFLCGGPATVLGAIWICCLLSAEDDLPVEEARKLRRLGLLALVLGGLAAVQFHLFWSGIERTF